MDDSGTSTFIQTTVAVDSKAFHLLSELATCRRIL